MNDPPEDRTRTISMLKSWNLWPLDAKHRDSAKCMCPRCFGDEPPPEVVVLAKRRKRKAFMWETDYDEDAA